MNLPSDKPTKISDKDSTNNANENNMTDPERRESIENHFFLSFPKDLQKHRTRTEEVFEFQPIVPEAVSSTAKNIRRPIATRKNIPTVDEPQSGYTTPTNPTEIEEKKPPQTTVDDQEVPKFIPIPPNHKSLFE